MDASEILEFVGVFGAALHELGHENNPFYRSLFRSFEDHDTSATVEEHMQALMPDLHKYITGRVFLFSNERYIIGLSKRTS